MNSSDKKWIVREKKIIAIWSLFVSIQFELYRIISDRTNNTDTYYHLALKLLDYFMDSHFIEDWQLKFVTIGCLLVAAKYEDVVSVVKP
jgi:hypothetical protein